jgi:hypothetical protein
MPRKILPKPSRLRFVVLNDSAPVLKMVEVAADDGRAGS